MKWIAKYNVYMVFSVLRLNLDEIDIDEKKNTQQHQQNYNEELNKVMWVKF